MRHNPFILILLCCSASLFGQQPLSPETIRLDGGWSFAESGSGKWLSAEVPGTVHQDLLRHGLLPDPFYGTNEQKIQWVESKDWEYKTSFPLDESQCSRQAARLVFEGLDTYADVYLNGALILSSDNMFKGYSIEVKDMLRKGENRLHVVFRSPVRKTLPQWETNGFEYPADNDHAEKKVSVFTRKAPYSFGWDWGIRMVTCGIWRPVTLELYDAARIDDYYVKQLALNDKEARLSNRIEIHNTTGETASAEVEVSCSLPGETASSMKKAVSLHPGSNLIEIPMTIKNPKRWMPNGWGEPTLYDVAAKVVCQGGTVAEKRRRIGLRTLRVVAEKDSIGESFYFEVNGTPLFAKGANYIPSDALLPNVTDERYETLFRDIKEAHINMIRVWGGGVYEDDRFYELADENGILIWQDFMFACTTYPADPPFLKRVEEEAEYNIRRLRNHPCIAMWCGNNEIQEGIKYWGWKKRFSPEVYGRFQPDYEKLFCELLPAQVKKFDEGRFYMHTSPYFANWGRPESWNVRDSHNWGIWYGRKPFESADEERCRFASEYGFQSFPEMKTIRTFASPADYRIDSEVMTAHQKSTVGNDLIAESMERYFIVPETFEDFVYVGLVLQGQGVRRSIEAHRRQRPYCMGSLYWQLNDSWPARQPVGERRQPARASRLRPPRRPRRTDARHAPARFLRQDAEAHEHEGEPSVQFVPQGAQRHARRMGNAGRTDGTLPPADAERRKAPRNRPKRLLLRADQRAETSGRDGTLQGGTLRRTLRDNAVFFLAGQGRLYRDSRTRGAFQRQFLRPSAGRKAHRHHRIAENPGRRGNNRQTYPGNLRVKADGFPAQTCGRFRSNAPTFPQETERTKTIP